MATFASRRRKALPIVCSLADAIAQQLQQTNNDASVRLSAVRDELAQVERQVENLLGAIEDGLVTQPERQADQA
jgi:hypothetical protein